ncbi:HAD family hydrolase [Congregibacter sp.]|uniref:HAD family hydrolase n=1 Tax=Congregibacter sp. TaxID=2744308 RepID=UPI003F6C08D9
MLRAIIFDLDGTLVDSRLDFTAMRAELGAPENLGLLEYVETLSSESARREAMAVIHRHELAGAEAAQWMPTAEEALHALHQQGTPIAIVTRNSRHAAQLTMRRLNMPDIPLKAREDAAPKPDPEALLMVAADWSIDPKHCAYIGDFRYDIQAAQRAGMLPVLYSQGGEPHENYDKQLQVLSDFRVLLALLHEQSDSSSTP